jgi:CubicO group peptidase (beta-lactamase class C family)
MSHPLPRTLALLEQGIADGLHLGAQICVRHQGRVVADFGMGECRPGVPMRADTSLFWFSCSKPIAAVALGRLLEAGLIGLHDPVTRYLPAFGAGGKEAITLHHLLTHTGGFRGSNHVDPEWSWAEILGFICDTPLEAGWVPGQKAGYHHTGSWYVLAEVVQRVTGRAYPDYVREEIFLPLGMGDSWVGMSPDAYRAAGDRLGALYTMGPERPQPLAYWDTERDSTECRPGGNGRGPVRELALLMEMLLLRGARDGVRILRPSTVELLTRRHREGMYDESFMQYIDWGLGFALCTRRPGQRVTSYGYGDHASLRTFGHGGMQASIAFADPEAGLVVAWVCNGLCGERLHRARNHAINNAIYHDLGLVAGAGEEGRR